MKTRDLTGIALDYVCHLHEQPSLRLSPKQFIATWNAMSPKYNVHYCTHGPDGCAPCMGIFLIQQQRIGIDPAKSGKWWTATILDDQGAIQTIGDSPMEAAMRCYCVKMTGEEVDLPIEIFVASGGQIQ